MSVTLEQLDAWMRRPEGEHLEFKEAKNNFHFEKLVKYCAALANEGGGHIVLGVTNKRPRKVVGTGAFEEPDRTQAGIFQKCGLRVLADEVAHPDGRVLVFTVPSRPQGAPIEVEGAFWMRVGDELAPMSADALKAIFDEIGPDFSAQLSRAKLDDLLPEAIERFRALWIRKSRNGDFARMNHRQLLTDAELLVDGGVTYAALVLMGSRAALSRHLAQAELVFEYRSSDATGPAQERRDYRVGFLSFMDELWDVINKRNDVQSYQDGLFMMSVPTFSEGAVREALLNAVAHRDYRRPGSVFVRQYPRRLEIESPGGFLPGITTENVLWQQSPRNRRIALAFQYCGLVERSGQGMNRMFEESIKQGKQRPDFTGTHEHQVFVTLRGEVQDGRFLRFLEKVGAERMESFTTDDLLILDSLRREERIPEASRPRLASLVSHGVIERLGRGRGTRYILSRDLYGALGSKGTHTRKSGLDRETHKALLLKHVRACGPDGAPMSELAQVLPELSTKSVQRLVNELKAEGKVSRVGRTRATRWRIPQQGEEP